MTGVEKVICPSIWHGQGREAWVLPVEARWYLECKNEQTSESDAVKESKLKRNAPRSASRAQEIGEQAYHDHVHQQG